MLPTLRSSTKYCPSTCKILYRLCSSAERQAVDTRFVGERLAICSNEKAAHSVLLHNRLIFPTSSTTTIGELRKVSDLLQGGGLLSYLYQLSYCLRRCIYILSAYCQDGTVEWSGAGCHCCAAGTNRRCWPHLLDSPGRANCQTEQGRVPTACELCDDDK